MTDRCHRCDRPYAGPDAIRHADGCECPTCLASCWSRFGQACDPIDWRARALEAERRLAEVDRPGPIFSIAIPHGLPAKILAALQWTFYVDALQVAHHGRLGYSDEAIEAIKRAAEGMVAAGLLEQTAGWDATWRLARKAARRG